MSTFMVPTAATTTNCSVLALGELLALTIAGREPDEKIQFTAEGARLRWLEEGALEVTPAAGRDVGLDLVLSAGVHGCEIVPIELLDRLVRGIASSKIQPRARLLLLFCNPPAMRRGARLVAQDLNRLFCAAHAAGPSDEAQRASRLEMLVSRFFRAPGRRRWHFDLHSAMRASKFPQFAVCPWVAGREISTEGLRCLQQAAVEAVLLQEKPSTTFSAHTATRHDAQAFTLELAEASSSAWPDCLGEFLQAAQCWIEATEPQKRSVKPLMKFRLAREIIKRSEQFVLRLPADIENFMPLSPGTLLAEDENDVLWVVEEQEARILFPLASVAIGERAGLIVVPLG